MHKNDKYNLKRKLINFLGKGLNIAGWQPDSSSFTFLISWMRSGSSLLSNLLLSNGTYHGIGETHVRYNSFSSLTESAFISCLFLNKLPKTNERYFDKILHNHLDYNLDEEIKKSSQFIFLTRDPAESAISINRMWKSFGPDRYSSSFDYLNHRLSQIAKLASQIPSYNKYLLDYSDVISNSDKFNQLSTFLGHKIGRSYIVKKHIGWTGIGDYSDNIKKGYIDEAKKSPSRIQRSQVLTPQERHMLQTKLNVLNDLF